MQLRVAEDYIQQFGSLAKTTNTIVLPANLTDIAGMIAVATRVFEETRTDGVPPPAGPPATARR
jgi:hypothetical protein